MSLCHQTFSFLKRTQCLQKQEKAATFLAFLPASQFSLVAQLGPTLCDSMDCSTPGFPVLQISQSLLKLMSLESMMPCNHLMLSPLSLPAFNLSQLQGLFIKVK